MVITWGWACAMPAIVGRETRLERTVRSVEDPLEVPGAADLVPEDGAQQAVARHDLEVSARHRLAPPVVIDPPLVADAHLAMGHSILQQADGCADFIG